MDMLQERSLKLAAWKKPAASTFFAYAGLALEPWTKPIKSKTPNILASIKNLARFKRPVKL
jgi:hypothetical protein